MESQGENGPFSRPHPLRPREQISQKRLTNLVRSGTTWQLLTAGLRAEGLQRIVKTRILNSFSILEPALEV